MAGTTRRPGRAAAEPSAARGPESGRRRADAQRNIDAILDAGLACLSQGPDVNVVEIARAAGVGRVTLYGHFPSKEALVDALVDRAITRANEALDSVDLTEQPVPQALSRLIASSWEILNQHRQLMRAGLQHLGQARMRAHHDQVMTRVEQLIARGQGDGNVRTDLPRHWLVTTIFTLMHAAAEEVNAERLESSTAGDVVTATVLAALAAPPT